MESEVSMATAGLKKGDESNGSRRDDAMRYDFGVYLVVDTCSNYLSLMSIG